MKIISLIANDIREFISNEFRIFIVFALGLSIASFSFVLLFSSCLSSKAEYQREFGYKIRTYVVSFNSNLTKSMKYNLIDELRDLVFNNIDDMSVMSLVDLDEKKSITVIGYYGKRGLFYYAEGQEFTNEQQKDASNVAIAWHGFFDYSKKTTFINDNFILRNKTYKLVGIAEYCPPNTVYIPLKTYLGDHYDISSLSITYSSKLDMESERVFKQHFNNYATVIVPPKIDAKQEREFLQLFFQFFCLLTFALINTFSLFKFWIFKNVTQIKVYRLCGAGNIKVYMIIMIESLVLTTIFFLLALIVYFVIWPYLKGYNSFYLLNSVHFIICYLIMLSVVYVNVHLTARKIIKSDDIYNFSWKDL